MMDADSAIENFFKNDKSEIKNDFGFKNKVKGLVKSSKRPYVNKPIPAVKTIKIKKKKKESDQININ